MTPEQFGLLLKLLEKIADRSYTITGATDWPMLVALVGMFGVVFTGLVGAMWIDLRGRLGDNTREHEKIWKAMTDCQDDCCPRGGKK